MLIMTSTDDGNDNHRGDGHNIDSDGSTND